MKAKRKIIVYIATSADGYIARCDGSVDWLDRPRPRGSYGYFGFFASIDTILWGRKTYDQALTMGGVGQFGLKVKNYVFTHRPPKQPAAGCGVRREAGGSLCGAAPKRARQGHLDDGRRRT
jgi:dihydrofolate reductase